MWKGLGYSFSDPLEGSASAFASLSLWITPVWLEQTEPLPLGISGLEAGDSCIISPRGAGQHLLTLRKSASKQKVNTAQNPPVSSTPPSSACLCLHHLSEMGKSCRDFSTSIPGFCLPPLPKQQRTPGGGKRRGGGQGLKPSPGKAEEYIPEAIGHCQSLWLTQKGDLGAGSGTAQRFLGSSPKGRGHCSATSLLELLLVWGQPGHLGELQSAGVGGWDEPWTCLLFIPWGMCPLAGMALGSWGGTGTPGCSPQCQGTGTSV